MSEWIKIKNVGRNICSSLVGQTCLKIIQVGSNICSPGATNCIKINDVKIPFRITNITQPSNNNYLIFFTPSLLPTSEITVLFTTISPSQNIWSADTDNAISPRTLNNLIINERYIYFRLEDTTNLIQTPIVTYDRIDNVFYDYIVEPNKWNIEIETTVPNQTFSIQFAGSTPNLTVDWGDGSIINRTTQGNEYKTYTNPGKYIIKINGSFGNNGGNIRLGSSLADKPMLLSTSPIPFIPGFTSFNSTFANCTSLTSIPRSLFSSITNITNVALCFVNCSSLNKIPPELFENNLLINNFTFCFIGVTIPTTIYSNLLINIAANASLRPNNVTFGGGNSFYNSSAESARSTLLEKSWQFDDAKLEGNIENIVVFVEDAGFTAVNGYYYYAGLFNGKPSYIDAQEGNYGIRYDDGGIWDSNIWTIYNIENDTVYYFSEYETFFPFGSSSVIWSNSDEIFDPPPNLSES